MAKKTDSSRSGGGTLLAGRDLAVCLVYPNRSRVGVSNLGFQKIYAAINSHESAFCDVAFLPDSGSAPFSMEREMPLDGFDVLAFSVTFEMDAPNLLEIVKGAGLPLERRNRTDSNPLVCAGGVAVTLNPEPLSDFIDFFVIGEGEDDVGLWLDRLAMSRGRPRSERLADISTLRGVYVPSLYEVRYNEESLPVERIAKESAPEVVARLYKSDYEKSGMAQCMEPMDSVFKESFLIETGKGCGQGCRFCAAGFIYRPVRHVAIEVLKEQAARGLTESKRLGLVGSAISEHPQIEELYDYILSLGGKIAVSSLRVGHVNAKTFERLAKGGCRTVTIAPEAGSSRLRRVVNKDIADDEIVNCAATAAAAGILNIKLYFLIGLPEERDEDIVAIAVLVKKIRDGFVTASKAHGRAGKITVGVNPFVPKPNTPFQWARFAPIGELKMKSKLLKSLLGGEPNVNLKIESAKNAAVQALLSLGSRRVGGMLADVVNEKNPKSWSAILRLPEAKQVYAREKGKDELLPWDFIDSIVGKEHLWAEYERAKSAKITPPCPPPLAGCKRCGTFDGNCS